MLPTSIRYHTPLENQVRTGTVILILEVIELPKLELLEPVIAAAMQLNCSAFAEFFLLRI
jgi:hypothetical protein